MRLYKVFYLASSLLLVSIGGLLSAICFLNDDFDRGILFAGISLGVLVLCLIVFVLFQILDSKLVTKALGKYKTMFDGIMKIDGGSSFDVTAKFYENGVVLTEQGERPVPFVYDDAPFVKSNKFFIDLKVHKLGVVRFLSNKAVKIKMISSLFS